MKFLKPSFSKIQREFLEKFSRFLKDEFGGEQLAMAERIGCDRSQVSRWANKENAPPEYVCRLLLKELGGDRIKKNLGHRIQYLREKVFEISLREFAWAFKLESLSQLEAVERGEVELPRHCIEMLMRDHLVSPSYLDYGEGGVFTGISHSIANLVAYLKDGFDIFVATPPKKHMDRLGLKCRLFLHRKREPLSQCVVTSTPGSFRSLTGGRLILEDVIWASLEAFSPSIKLPPALVADEKGWKALQNSCFYRKDIFFFPGCHDRQCSGKLREILDSLYDKFKAHKADERQKNEQRSVSSASAEKGNPQKPA